MDGGEAYRRDQQFFIVAGTGFEDTQRANYKTPTLPEGRYELVVSNKAPGYSAAPSRSRQTLPSD